MRILVLIEPQPDCTIQSIHHRTGREWDLCRKPEHFNISGTVRCPVILGEFFLGERVTVIRTWQDERTADDFATGQRPA